MILVDAVAETKGGEIFVPMYHRGHLSLRSDTQVTVCLLPAPVSTLPIPGVRELVMSPIEYRSWEHLIRITALFRDVPGVVRKLAYAIQKQEIDILYEESATIDRGRFHRVEILADARESYRQCREANNNDAGLLPALERRLKAICLDELAFTDAQPRLKVRPMEGLRNAWHSTQYYARITQKIQSSLPPWVRAPITRGRLQIPQRLLDQLNPSPRVVLVSDTRDRILRALVLDNDVYFTYVRVTHQDQIGALFLIADVLSRAFTAVLTLTRLKNQGGRNDVEFLLYSPSYSALEQEQARRDIIAELLGCKLLRDLQISLSYPKRAGNIEADSKPPTSTGVRIPDQPVIAPLDADLARESTSTAMILRNKIERYQQSPQDAHTESTKRKLAAARALATQEGDDPLPQPQIFISYNFDRDDLFQVVASVLELEGGVEIATGKNPNGMGPFRDTIRDRIKASHGFIAIWDAKANSPWLMWELGVAQAFGIPVVILPHANLQESPHLEIIPELHHERFQDDNLRRKFSARCPTFRNEVFNFYRKLFHLRTPPGME